MSNLHDQIRRLARPLTMMALRVSNTAAKFLLALYTARYLGLSDLGVYGLLVGGTILTPAVLGLGTCDWVVRQIVTMSRADAIASIATRLAQPVVMHAIAQPLLWAVNAMLGAPVSWPLVWACGLILFLEHVANDANDLLIARNRAMLSNVLLFVRSGLWPLGVIAWGALDPSARTLECLLAGWIGGLVLLWMVLAAFATTRQRWRAIRIRWRWLASAIPVSWPFYIKDLAAAASLHLDRFVISLFLGLELTGVYTLFWSITNVVHNLAVYTVVHPQVPGLIAAHAGGDLVALRQEEHRVRNEAAYWAVALAIGAAITVPLLLPFLDRPALQANLMTFWLILVATLVRTGADTYGFFLLVLHRDHAIAVISVCGAIGSAALNMLLIPLLGLPGAALAYAVTGAGLFAARFMVASDGKSATNGIAPQPAKS